MNLNQNPYIVGPYIVIVAEHTCNQHLIYIELYT